MGSKTRVWVFCLISSPAPEPWVYVSRQVATLPFLSENENGPYVSGPRRKLIQSPCAEGYGNIVYQSLRRCTFGTSWEQNLGAAWLFPLGAGIPHA